jgi:hypothetical protein
MNKTTQVEIQQNRFRLVLLLIASLMFVLIAIAFVMNPAIFVSPTTDSVDIYIAGVAGILFFGFMGFSISKRIYDNKPGLMISDGGIVDNSGLSASYIPWSDVTEIKEKKFVNQKHVSIGVKNPWDYIKKQPYAFGRKAIKKNSELRISANRLKCDYSDLMQLLKDKFEEYKAKTNR